MRSAIRSVCWLDAGFHRVAILRPAVLPHGAVVVIASKTDGLRTDRLLLCSAGASRRFSLERRSEILVALVGAPPELLAELEFEFELEFERNYDERSPLDLPVALPLEDFAVQAFMAPAGEHRAAAGGFLSASSETRGIQGVCLNWPSRPRELILGYSAHLDDGTTTPAVAPGGLVGNRLGGGLLMGFSIFLGGKAAEGLELTLESCFGGGERQALSGRKLAVTAPTGREALTGLGVTFSRLGRLSTRR